MAGVRAAVPAPLLTPHIRWQKEPPLSGGFFACGCSQAGHGLIGVGRQACAGTTARRGPALTAGRENPRGSSTARSSRASQGAVGGYLGSKPTRLRGFLWWAALGSKPPANRPFLSGRGGTGGGTTRAPAAPWREGVGRASGELRSASRSLVDPSKLCRERQQNENENHRREPCGEETSHDHSDGFCNLAQHR
jgi:hypothetical protein